MARSGGAAIGTETEKERARVESVTNYSYIRLPCTSFMTWLRGEGKAAYQKVLDVEGGPSPLAEVNSAAPPPPGISFHQPEEEEEEEEPAPVPGPSRVAVSPYSMEPMPKKARRV